MNRRWTQIGLLACSLLGVAVLAVVDMRRTAPGPLTHVHGRVEELDGGANCVACHGGWFASMTDSCLECHADIGAQIEQADGLHGRLGAPKAQQCSLCHSEHHGANFAIVNKQSFALAGSRDPANFDHRLVGFEMDGKHLELDCAACHEHAAAEILPAGARRYLGLDQDCASCHEDVHQGSMIVACASCHGQSAWDGLHSLGHERFLPLVGGHGGLDCRTCHAENSTHSLEALGAGSTRAARRTCLDCHDSPHDDAFLAGVARLAGQPAPQACVGCHAAEHESFRDERLTVTDEQHAESGYALDAPHHELTCAACHAPELPEFAQRYPGRDQDRCSACHADPHAGQFASGPFSGGDCLACHERQRFEPHAFTAVMHERAALPLTGVHAETECHTCHEQPAGGGPEAARVFRGTPARCELCHADAHAGFFAEGFVTSGAPAQGECAQCHGTGSFSDVPAERFDHARWTGFAVRGAHEQEGCAACHAPSAAPDGTGRSFGRVEAHFGAFTGCVTCHADPHAGRFDQAGLPQELDGRRDCARCHDEVSFRSFPRGFDHGRWTGFALTEEHAAVSCAGCHAPLARADAVGRTWGRSRGARCSDCHPDPHAGQFTVAGRNDCARCHDSAAAGFVDFDHDRDSVFPLSEAHARLECAACHKPVLHGEDEVVHYKPLKQECADCHGVHEEVLLRRQPRKG